MGAAVLWKPRVHITYFDVSTFGSSGGVASVSASIASLVSRLRLARLFADSSSISAAAAFRRAPALDSRSVSSCSGETARGVLERPRLRDDALLAARLLRVEGFSVLMLGPAFSGPGAACPRRVFLSRGGDTSIASGDGALSLIGLTSPGPGRGGDTGDPAMLWRGDLFHGVEEPGVSIESRGREERDSENDGTITLGVCETRGWPIGTGV